LLGGNEAKPNKISKEFFKMSKPMTALELRNHRSKIRTEKAEAKTVLKVNGEFVAVNNSRVEDFIDILCQSGVHYTTVNQDLWDLLHGYNYEEVSKAIEKYNSENEYKFDFISNECYAIVGDEDSEKSFNMKKNTAPFGFHKVLLTVNTSSHYYQNSFIDIILGFEYE
jgi:hypothetical protein